MVPLRRGQGVVAGLVGLEVVHRDLAQPPGHLLDVLAEVVDALLPAALELVERVPHDVAADVALGGDQVLDVLVLEELQGLVEPLGGLAHALEVDFVVVGRHGSSIPRTDARSNRPKSGSLGACEGARCRGRRPSTTQTRPKRGRPWPSDLSTPRCRRPPRPPPTRWSRCRRPCSELGATIETEAGTRLQGPGRRRLRRGDQRVVQRRHHPRPDPRGLLPEPDVRRPGARDQRHRAGRARRPARRPPGGGPR